MGERRTRSTADQPECDGLCVSSDDVGVPGYGIAYPHPSCPLHSPDDVCGCGSPDSCMSPTHGQVTHAEALFMRYSQSPNGAPVQPLDPKERA